jgi:glycosyltransferase involved in cell wall biosynthesis
MLRDVPNSTQTPLFSVVIAVDNDWGPLEQCLQSPEAQMGELDFEVIVVDDGSEETAHESIRRWNGNYPLTIVQEPYTGIAAARNRGLQNAGGSVFVFTDADCRFQANCLSALATALNDFPQHNCFQLHSRKTFRLIAVKESVSLELASKCVGGKCARNSETAGSHFA